MSQRIFPQCDPHLFLQDQDLESLKVGELSLLFPAGTLLGPCGASGLVVDTSLGPVLLDSSRSCTARQLADDLLGEGDVGQRDGLALNVWRIDQDLVYVKDTALVERIPEFQ